MSSARRFGGKSEDYLAIHNWFDESKKIVGNWRHRMLRHHAEGIFMCETIFGVSITNSAGKIVPTRLIGEQHVMEDMGFIPSFAHWAEALEFQPWMNRQVQRISTVIDLKGDQNGTVEEEITGTAQTHAAE